MAKYLIGVTGEKGKGKTSFVHVLTYLLSINGYETNIFHFADYIKQVARECFGEEIGAIHGKLSEKQRNLLCSIGDALRGIDKNCLVNVVEKKIKKQKNFIIVGDVRLEREAELIRKYQGVLVKVESKSFKRNENYLQNHITEKEISALKPDFVIFNEGTFSDLIHQAKNVLSHFVSEYEWKS